MNISDIAINPLAKIICGDNTISPYMTGPSLVNFFNKHGFDDIYENGFNSRWKYTEDNLRTLNNSNELNKVIESILDPRRFITSGKNVEEVVDYLNVLFKYDNYELVKVGDLYKISNRAEVAVASTTTKKVDHDFISEQIAKCDRKLSESDFNGAITNARSLIEAVFIHIIETIESVEVRNDGSIESLWKRVKSLMKLDIEKETYPDFVIQILSGIDTSVKGLAGLSNNA
jgi:hypothetical protein